MIKKRQEERVKGRLFSTVLRFDHSSELRREE
jgi:hypothetical protein